MGPEKLLDEHRALVGEVLKFNGLNENWLNCYDTPEPFFEYVHTRSGPMTVLILENKDTWYTFRKLMQDTGKGVIAGTRVDVLLYGEGNKITKRGALEEYNAGMLRGRAGQAGEFLYFGDLDQEGIRLFFRTAGGQPRSGYQAVCRALLAHAQTGCGRGAAEIARQKRNFSPGDRIC